MKLKIGQAAPNFSAPDQTGQQHQLADYRGSWLLLYFYPKDDTPGCTKEACNLRDNFSLLKSKLKILGVSADSVTSHQKFAQKYTLPFPLLADSDKKIIRAYGADGLIFPKRVSFLIDPQGKIAQIYEQVDVNQHAQQILADLE